MNRAYLRILIIMLNLIILVTSGILVSGESDDFGKAGDSMEFDSSVDPFDSCDHGSCSVFAESYHTWKSYQHGEFVDCDNLFNMVNLMIVFNLGILQVNLGIVINLDKLVMLTNLENSWIWWFWWFRWICWLWWMWQNW